MVVNGQSRLSRFPMRKREDSVVLAVGNGSANRSSLEVFESAYDDGIWPQVMPGSHFGVYTSFCSHQNPHLCEDSPCTMGRPVLRRFMIPDDCREARTLIHSCVLS